MLCCALVVQAVLRDPEDETRLRLLYASRSPPDIILRAELDRLAGGDPKGRLRVTYVVDQVSGSPPREGEGEGPAWGGAGGRRPEVLKFTTS